MFRKHSDPDCEMHSNDNFYSYSASPNCKGKIHIKASPQAQTFFKNFSINCPLEMGIKVSVSMFALNFCCFYNELWLYPVSNILDTFFSATYIIARDTLEIFSGNISFLTKKIDFLKSSSRIFENLKIERDHVCNQIEYRHVRQIFIRLSIWSHVADLCREY